MAEVVGGRKFARLNMLSGRLFIRLARVVRGEAEEKAVVGRGKVYLCARLELLVARWWFHRVLWCFVVLRGRTREMIC